MELGANTARLIPWAVPARVAARRAACRSCIARSRTVCAAVPEAQLDRVALIKLSPRRVPAGALIYAEHEHCAECFTVLDGWVALTATVEDGRRVVLDFALPGDYFGFQADPDTPRGQSAIALTAARLCPLPRAEMQPLLATDPGMSKHLSHLIALHEARAHDRLVNNASHDARGRVAHLLIELYFRQNRHLPQIAGETIDLPLTLALIGETVELTIEHVSRTLRRLREDGVIQLRRGRLLIRDPEALIRISGVEDRPLADAAIPR